jgi:BMFP domain-containing protein YqiC
MLDDVRRYMRAGIKALSGQRPDEVMAKIQALAERMAAVASGLLEWSAEARASLMREVKDLVARQIQEMGVATRQELEALRARLERLEQESVRSVPAASASRRRPAKRAGTSAVGRSSASSRSRSGAGRSKSGAGGSKSAAGRSKSEAGGSKSAAGRSRSSRPG